MKKEASHSSQFEKKILDLVKNRKMLNFGASHALAGAGMGALGGGALGAVESVAQPQEAGSAPMLDKVLRYGTMGAALGGGLGASRGAGIAKKLKSEQLGQVKKLLREGINPGLLHSTLQSGGHLGDLHVMDYLNKSNTVPDKLYGGALRATGFGEGLGSALPGELDQIGLHQAQKGLNEVQALKDRENRQRIWENISGAARTAGSGAAAAAKSVGRGVKSTADYVGKGVSTLREHNMTQVTRMNLTNATKKHDQLLRAFEQNPNDPVVRRAFEEAKMEVDNAARQKANMVEHYRAKAPEEKSKATEKMLNESKQHTINKAEFVERNTPKTPDALTVAKKEMNDAAKANDAVSYQAAKEKHDSITTMQSGKSLPRVDVELEQLDKDIRAAALAGDDATRNALIDKKNKLTSSNKTEIAKPQSLSDRLQERTDETQKMINLARQEAQHEILARHLNDWTRARTSGDPAAEAKALKELKANLGSSGGGKKAGGNSGGGAVDKARRRNGGGRGRGRGGRP